jgi:hypothetical protein
MQVVEFDGLPAGVTIEVNGVIVKGTGIVKEEKESA